MAPMWQVPSAVRETASVSPPVPILRDTGDSFRALVLIAFTAGRRITHGPFGLAVSRTADGTCPICARCRITNFEHAASPCCARSTQPPQPESRTLVKVAAVGAASTVRSTGQRRATYQSWCARGRWGRRPLGHPRGNARPKGPCVIGRPAVKASTTKAGKESAVLTQDWHPRTHACISPGMGEGASPPSPNHERTRTPASITP